MAALIAHRSLGGRLRSELYYNVCMLSLKRPMLEELCRMMMGGPQAFDKLNQSLLIHLSYYLATIIDPKLAQLISWPLYDKASERTYKTQLLGFVSTFYNKTGSLENSQWITPIQSSYLSAGGFKVMQLLFEMSLLALNKLIKSDFKMNDERLSACDMSSYLKDKSKLDSAIEKTRKEFTQKSIDFAAYKKKAETISQYYQIVISDLERENEIMQGVLSKCVSRFKEAEELIDLDNESQFLIKWNESGDNMLTALEDSWTTKTKVIKENASICRHASRSTVARSTLPDKSSHQIEYVQTKDIVNIRELETQVSSQQRYILKNIVKDNVLNFPNLLKGYTISACYLYKNIRCAELSEGASEHVENISSAYGQLAEKGQWLVESLLQLKVKFEERSSTSSYFDDSVEETVIPALPDIKIREETWQQHQLNKPFTPLQSSKIQFNVKNRTTPEFCQPRSTFLAPTHALTRPSVFKNIAKLHTENLFTSFNSNTSTGSHPKDLNKTTADCSTGFSKEQVLRLLSSRKSSSKKIRKHDPASHGKARRSCLFKDTPENSFTASGRSVSSPNLVVPFEIKKKNFHGHKVRSLCVIAQENSPEQNVDMSGFERLQDTPTEPDELKSTPAVVLTTPGTLVDTSCSVNVPKNEEVLATNSNTNVEEGYKTPNSRNVVNEKKTNSIERLIEKYRRIRNKNAAEQSVTTAQIQSFVLSPITDTSLNKENNANEINIDISVAGPLPDLVSPSWSGISKVSPNSECNTTENPPTKTNSKCRESLGTALGVDNSFLDQFDFIE